MSSSSPLTLLTTSPSPTLQSFLSPFNTEDQPKFSLISQNFSSAPSTPSLPPEFTEMTSRSRNEVLAYSILFIVAATGNLTVFFSVCHQLAKLKWRITVLMLHLSIADLIVTFFLMPLEICWRLTIQWIGGEVLCKLCQFLRAFGLYLSSNILICISLDRFIAILFPLRMVGATRRVKTMIALAWLAAGISAAPQSVVFSVQAHPKYPSFKQCVSFGFFSNPTQEIVYNVFSVSAMYFIPLIVTIFTYSMILWKISSKSHGLLKQSRGVQDLRNTQRTHSYPYSNIGYSATLNPNVNSVQCSTTQQGNSESANLLARAKKRTLRMTFIIVIVFVFCWTPYAVITLWYTFDQEGAKRLDPSLQDALFMMAVANSCLNPIVYGNYTKKTAGPIFNCGFTWMCNFCCCHTTCSTSGPGYTNRRRTSVEQKGPRTSSLLAITSVI